MTFAAGWTADLVSAALSRFGLAGVSVGALMLMLAVPLWARKASKVGGVTASAASTAITMTQAVAIALAVLLVLGVISVDIARGGEVVSTAVELARDHADVLKGAI